MGSHVVGEDATEVGGHRLTTDHLASIEANYEAVVRDRGGHCLGIARVPSGDETLVQAGDGVLGVHARRGCHNTPHTGVALLRFVETRRRAASPAWCRVAGSWVRAVLATPAE